MEFFEDSNILLFHSSIAKDNCWNVGECTKRAKIALHRLFLK